MNLQRQEEEDNFKVSMTCDSNESNAKELSRTILWLHVFHPNYRYSKEFDGMVSPLLPPELTWIEYTIAYRIMCVSWCKYLWTRFAVLVQIFTRRIMLYDCLHWNHNSWKFKCNGNIKVAGEKGFFKNF